jgi:hypothetical protein
LVRYVALDCPTIRSGIGHGINTSGLIFLKNIIRVFSDSESLEIKDIPNNSSVEKQNQQEVISQKSDEKPVETKKSLTVNLQVMDVDFRIQKVKSSDIINQYDQTVQIKKRYQELDKFQKKFERK